MYKKIVIFVDSLFKRRVRERVSFPDFEIQEYENEYNKCNACGQKHAIEKFFLPEKFHFSENGLVDLIQVNYTSSPRGAHSIVINTGDITSKKNRYEGRNSPPNNLYIKIKPLYVERKKLSIVAIKGEGSLYSGNNFVCDISAGNSGTWSILSSEKIRKTENEDINFKSFLHNSCAKSLAPSLWKGLGGESFLYNPPLDLERIGILDVYSFHNYGIDDEYIFNSNIYFLANIKDIAEEKFLVERNGGDGSRKAISCKDGKIHNVIINGESISLNGSTQQLETEYKFFNNENVFNNENDELKEEV